MDDEGPAISADVKLMVAPSGAPTPRAADTEPSDRYELEPRPDPPPIPNGWYAACPSHVLAAGQVRSFIAVGRELVVYRASDGTARVIGAHCPHLGAHLGGGQVQDGCIKCSYHGWSYDGEGRCVDIPYSDARIPARAQLNTYEVCEQDGFVFFWFHRSSEAPTYRLPRVEEVGQPGWSQPRPWSFELVAAIQEMAENNVDYAHLRYVHRRPYVPAETSEFTTDGPFSTVVERLPDGKEFVRHAWGPGVALLRLMDMMTIVTTTTPIDRRHCRLQWDFYFPDEFASLADEFIAGVTGEFGIMADVPIWRDKIFLERPVLVRGDGNIAEFRRWYSQFYA